MREEISGRKPKGKYIELNSPDKFRQIRDKETTGAETFRRVCENEFQRVSNIINGCTHETFQEFIQDESEETIETGKTNGYIHYKLPNGLHVYLYMEDFDMSRVDRSSGEDYWRTEIQSDGKNIHELVADRDNIEVYAFTGEIGEETRTQMQKCGVEAEIYSTEEQPFFRFSIGDNKLEWAEYAYNIKSENLQVQRFISFDEGKSGELITCIESPKRRRTFLYPCDDSQLLDSSFFASIQTSDNLSDEQKSVMIGKLLELKETIENEVKNYQDIRLGVFTEKDIEKTITGMSILPKDSARNQMQLDLHRTPELEKERET